MQELDIVNLICDILKPLNITVIEGWYDENINDTHVTIQEYLEQENNFEDDTESEIIHNIQLDIWSKNSLESYELKKNIKKILKQNNFTDYQGQDFYETETKIYHRAMRFTYIEYI